MSFNSLLAIVPPPDMPVGVPHGLAWDRIETSVRHQLPDDYKEFVSTYGAGYLGRFIHVFVPSADSPHLSLDAQVIDICEIYRGLRHDEGETQVPYPVHPETPGLLLGGETITGSTCSG